MCRWQSRSKSFSDLTVKYLAFGAVPSFHGLWSQFFLGPNPMPCKFYNCFSSSVQTSEEKSILLQLSTEYVSSLIGVTCIQLLFLLPATFLRFHCWCTSAWSTDLLLVNLWWQRAHLFQLKHQRPLAPGPIFLLLMLTCRHFWRLIFFDLRVV